jgi:predicted metal-dependent hydrolase
MAPEGNVRVAAPLDLDDDEVRTYVIAKIPWIKKHTAQFQAQTRQSPRKFVSDESRFVDGRR